MKSYGKYVPSGVDWIGDIPEGWYVKKLKYIALICNGQDYKDVEAYDGEYPVIGSGGEFARAERYLYDKVSVLLGRKGTIDKPLLVSYPFWTVDTMYYTAINKDYSPQYLYYLATTINFDLYQYGSTVPSMSQRDLKEIPFAVPHIDVQTAIADYLDHEAARIDNIIKAKEMLIARLNEKRTALITHTVTKGLDPNAKIKPSGVEWIGNIPEGWEVKKIKYVAQKPLMYGANESPDDFDETQPRYIRITDIGENGKLRDDIAVSLDIEKAKPYLLKKDDILFARSGATVGKSYIFNQDILACFAGYMIKFEPKKTKVVPKFAYYITFSKMYLNWIESNTIQATIQNVSAEKYNNFYLPLPQVELQDTIVAFLNAETSKLDNTIEKTKLSIEKLKEYRTALISACVTGKIDVRSV